MSTTTDQTLDERATAISARHATAAAALTSLQAAIAELTEAQTSALEAADFPKADSIRDELTGLRAELPGRQDEAAQLAAALATLRREQDRAGRIAERDNLRAMLAEVIAQTEVLVAEVPRAWNTLQAKLRTGQALHEQAGHLAREIAGIDYDLGEGPVPDQYATNPTRWAAVAGQDRLQPVTGITLGEAIRSLPAMREV